MDIKLTAKTAFVSGSTAGIGFAIARSRERRRNSHHQRKFNFRD